MVSSQNTQDEHDVQAFMSNVNRLVGFTGIPVRSYVDNLVMSDKSMSPYFVSLLLQRGLVSVSAADVRAAAERVEVAQALAALKIRDGAVAALNAAVEVARALESVAKGAEQ